MNTLFYLSLLSPVIPLLIGIRKFKSLLWLYAITGISFDLLIILCNRVFSINPFPVGNLFLITEFIIVSFLFRREIFKNTKLFILLTSALSLYFIVTGYDSFALDLNTSAGSLFSLSFVIYSVVGLYLLLKEQKDIYLERSYLFWLCVAFLIYASGNLFVFLFKDYMRATDDVFFKELWNTFFRILNIIKNIILAFAIVQKK